LNGIVGVGRFNGNLVEAS